MIIYIFFSGNIYELHTRDDGNAYQYNYSIITVWDERLSFSVKACNDAHIMLQTVPGSTTDKHFEIVIGGWSNTRSAIRASRGVRVATHVNDSPSAFNVTVGSLHK
jgi:hypothetical protein